MYVLMGVSSLSTAKPATAGPLEQAMNPTCPEQCIMADPEI